MGDIEIKIDKEDVLSWIQDKISNMENRFYETIQAILHAWDEAMRDEAPVQTGALRDSITIEYAGEYGGSVYPDIEYAPYVVLGTRSHWIGSPVNIMGVGWRYIGQHPGTSPNDFPGRAYDSSEGTVQTIIDNFMDWFSE